SQDWLNITQTTQAKNKIRQLFKKQRREEKILKGKELVFKEIKDLNLHPKEVLTSEHIKRVNEKFNYTSEDDMYAAVGYKGITAALIATRLTHTIRKTQEIEKDLEETIEEVVKPEASKNKTNKKDTAVHVAGVDN